jgi:hypothetical protein
MSLRIPIDPVSLPLAEHVLRDLNISPEVHFPIISGIQYVDLTMILTTQIVNKSGR